MFTNGLTLAQTERLVVLMEEQAESIQATCKVIRFGFESKHPDGGPTNREALEIELGNVLNAVCMLSDADDLDVENIITAAALKAEVIGQFLKYQDNLNTSEEKQ